MSKCFDFIHFFILTVVCPSDLGKGVYETGGPVHTAQFRCPVVPREDVMVIVPALTQGCPADEFVFH